MADQAGMRQVNRAIAALAEDPEPPDAFVRGSYRRLRVGAYRVLYEVAADVVTIVRVDRAAIRATGPASGLAWTAASL